MNSQMVRNLFERIALFHMAAWFQAAKRMMKGERGPIGHSRTEVNCTGCFSAYHEAVLLRAPSDFLICCLMTRAAIFAAMMR